MNTYMPSAASIERKWYVVDATDKTLGRLSSEVANVLRGKNKPIYTPFLDCGDYVIVINADKVKVTGRKLDQKIYFRHSEYIGGSRYTSLREAMEKKPVKVVEHDRGKGDHKWQTKLATMELEEENPPLPEYS